MPITVEEVRTKPQLKQFIKLPWKVYEDDPCWVPPLILMVKEALNQEKNPFFEHGDAQYFLATDNGRPVGRIAAFIDRGHNRVYRSKVGGFGFFETINDEAVARALIDTAEQWVAERGMDTMMGPMNFSILNECGALIDGFEWPPMVFLAHTPPYYAELMERLGFGKSRDLYAYLIDQNEIPPKLERVARQLERRRGLLVRHADKKHLMRELQIIGQVYNDAWSENWGFVPMTPSELNHLAKEFVGVIDTRLTFIAEIDGEPAGFAISVPNINEAIIKANGRLFPFGIFKLLWYRRKIKGLRIALMGVRKEYRNLGLDALFYYRTYVVGSRLGYERGEMSWILEDNLPMIRVLETLGARRYKTYRIYERAIKG